MADFDRLNRETSEFNNRNVSRYDYHRSEAEKKPVASREWLNYLNNQTFKANNGQFSKHYY